MTEEEIQDMAHEINSLSTDITALMIWIAENVEPLQKENAEQKEQIEKMKCCGNCSHQYEGKIEDGVRCKDHYSDSVCKHWEYDNYTVSNRLDNEWS